MYSPNCHFYAIFNARNIKREQEKILNQILYIKTNIEVRFTSDNRCKPSAKKYGYTVKISKVYKLVNIAEIA